MKDFENKYKLYNISIDGFDFKFRELKTSLDSINIIIDELNNNEYGFKNINLDKDETFIDVGANIGIVSIYVKKKFGCKVIAFEPVPENMENFKENIILNGLKLEDFELHEKAVYDDNDKILKLVKNSENTGCSGVFDQSDDIIDTVETIKLSPFLTKDVKYLKLDCELSEYAIIPEIKNNLKNLKYIGIEFHRAQENQNPLDLYKQIRETFTGEMFMSAWDYTGKDILSELLSEDEKYKNKEKLNLDLKIINTEKKMIAVTIGVGNDWYDFAKWAAGYVERNLGLKTYIIGEEFLKYSFSPNVEDMSQRSSCIKFLLFDIFPGVDRIMFFDADWRPVRKFNILDYVPDEEKLYFCQDKDEDNLGLKYGLPPNRYFNAGWFVASRKHSHLFKKCYETYNKYDTVWFDQCIMNQVFNKEVTLVEPKLNVKLDLSAKGGWASYSDLENDWNSYCDFSKGEILGFHHGCNYEIYKKKYEDFIWKQ